MCNPEQQSYNVLYLTHDGLADPLGQSQILPYLIGLAEKGYRITIVSFEKKESFKLNSAVLEALCKQNAINWIPLSYHKTPPVISTVYDLYILWRTARALHRKEKFALVHCRSYVTALVGMHLKKRFGIKFIFDMRGFWADERIEGGIWNLKNPAYRLVYTFFKKKEKQFLVESDHIISLTRNAKKEIESWGIRTPITVIPTCVDLELFDPTKISEDEKKKLKEELGLRKDDFVLLYLGSWGTWYLTEQMLNFFEEVKNQYPLSKFLIISPDSVDIADRQFANEVIIKSVNRLKVPLYVSIASAAVFFIKPSFSKKASSATKTGEIMAMNIPMLTNGGWGDVDTNGSEGVLILKDFSKESMSASATKLIQMANLPHSNESRVAIDHPLALKTGILTYDRVYRQLLI